MKKIINFILLMLLGLFTLSSCVGQTTPPIDPDDPIHGDDPNHGDESDKLKYTVQLYRNNQIWIPNIEIAAIFINDSSVSEVIIDDFTGIAEFRGDGDYNVHLSAVPEGYTYDPNAYTVDPQHTDIIIDLYPVLDYVSGNGTDPYVKPYEVKQNGYYKVDIDSINDRKYFTFLPNQSGEYNIESICDIYSDDVDPIGISFYGTEHYINENTPDGYEIYDDGGINLETGFTTNFKFSITFDVTELNVAKVFAIEAESKIEEYPCTVYFKIEYVDEYSKGDAFNPAVLDPTEIPPITGVNITPNGGDFTWIFDLNNGILDVDNCKYNSNNGLWYYYDESFKNSKNWEDGYGIKLVVPVSLSTEIAALSVGTEANEEFTFAQALGYQPTLLCLYNEENERVCYNYMLFGEGPLYVDGNPYPYNGDCYFNYADSRGFVYVTNELMTFYQLLSNKQEYFKDGNGNVEQKINSSGYHVSSDQDSQWLFACGLYI